MDEIEELQKENDTLRAIIAKSEIACIYCGLPASDLARCPHGFPGCSRADDMLNDPREDDEVSAR
jgi:hypothetical protein